MKPDWKDAPEWAQYLAQDLDGNWYWFSDEPFFQEEHGGWGALHSSQCAYAGYSDLTAEKRPE